MTSLLLAALICIDLGGGMTYCEEEYKPPTKVVCEKDPYTGIVTCKEVII